MCLVKWRLSTMSHLIGAAGVVPCPAPRLLLATGRAGPGERQVARPGIQSALAPAAIICYLRVLFHKWYWYLYYMCIHQHVVHSLGGVQTHDMLQYCSVFTGRGLHHVLGGVLPQHRRAALPVHEEVRRVLDVCLDNARAAAHLGHHGRGGQ